MSPEEEQVRPSRSPSWNQRPVATSVSTISIILEDFIYQIYMQLHSEHLKAYEEIHSYKYRYLFILKTSVSKFEISSQHEFVIWLFKMFKRENDRMYEDLVSLKDSVQQIESKVVRIAELQDIFTEKVSFWNMMGSISPTFYEQLLHSKIPKVQKSCLTWQSFLHFRDLHM